MMSTHGFMDANNAVDRVNTRSQTGILLLCNKAPVICHSKIQNDDEV